MSTFLGSARLRAADGALVLAAVLALAAATGLHHTDRRALDSTWGGRPASTVTVADSTDTTTDASLTSTTPTPAPSAPAGTAGITPLDSTWGD